MSDEKYDSKTIVALLKLMLSVRDDLTEEEKENLIKLTEQIYKNLHEKNNDHEDKQSFAIEDYKRRN